MTVVSFSRKFQANAFCLRKFEVIFILRHGECGKQSAADLFGLAVRHSTKVGKGASISFAVNLISVNTMAKFRFLDFSVSFRNCVAYDTVNC